MRVGGYLSGCFLSSFSTKATDGVDRDQLLAVFFNLVLQGLSELFSLIDHFRDKGRRKALFKEYKEIEMIYEIISPDAFLRPYMSDYGTLSSIYEVVRAAYAERVYVDKAFQRKTDALVKEHVGTSGIEKVHDLFEINQETIELIKKKEGGTTTKVINLIKSIEQTAENESNDPFLIAMAERAKLVQEKFEDRQATTAKVLDELLKLVESNERRKKAQAEKGFDGLNYFVYRTLLDARINAPEEISKKIKVAFTEHPGWKQSEKELRELRKKVTFAIFTQEDDLNKVTAIVEDLFALLGKASSI